MKDNEWNDNMDELYDLSLNMGGVIKFERRIHPGLVADAKTSKRQDIVQGDPLKLYDWMMKMFGHCVLGKYQFIYTKGKKKVSVIRNGGTFGDYEFCRIDTPSLDIERSATAKGALTRIKELLE